MKELRYIIADNLKLYHKKHNLTQTKLAELSELSVLHKADRGGAEEHVRGEF